MSPIRRRWPEAVERHPWLGWLNDHLPFMTMVLGLALGALAFWTFGGKVDHSQQTADAARQAANIVHRTQIEGCRASLRPPIHGDLRTAGFRWIEADQIRKTNRSLRQDLSRSRQIDPQAAFPNIPNAKQLIAEQTAQQKLEIKHNTAEVRGILGTNCERPNHPQPLAQAQP